MINSGDKRAIINVMLSYYIQGTEKERYRAICRNYNTVTLSRIRKKVKYTTNILSPFFRDGKLLSEISQKLIEEMV